MKTLGKPWACHAGGRGFEPRLSRHHFKDLAPLFRSASRPCLCADPTEGAAFASAISDPSPSPAPISSAVASRQAQEHFAIRAAWQSAIGECALKVRSFIVLAAAALGLASCWEEAPHTEQQRACIAQRYSDYDARQLSQCVDVCKACMKGNNVTCNTSCRLKGAS